MKKKSSFENPEIMSIEEISDINLFTIENLPATSPLTIKRFKLIGIETFWDLLNYFPYRYENYSLISPIDKLQEGEKVTVIGKVAGFKNEITRRGFKIQKIIIEDNDRSLELVWYNQPYILSLFKINEKIAVAGQIKKYGYKLVMEPEEFERYEGVENLKHTGKIIPIYPEKKGLSSRTIREKIFYLLNFLKKVLKEKMDDDLLPKEIIDYNNLIKEKEAYYHIHYPDKKNFAAKARERLAFDELFIIQISAQLIKKEWEKERVSHKFKIKEFQPAIKKFITTLPFNLTDAQKKVLGEIFYDLQKERPMNRLLHGDVGSGKTVVAAICCYIAFINGFQSLFMAPTEILAQQHYQTISKLFENYPIKIGLQTGSKKSLQKNKTEFDIVIGTHALLNEKLKFKNVGFVVIDEQHRFGVRQRAMLKEKGINPHLLTMTATPIPRTVALTLYGELDISYLDQMPKGRLPIKTFLVPSQKRKDAYDWIKKQIAENDASVFIICPLIEESSIETMKSIKAAKKEFENLKKIFSSFNLGLLHGRMKNKEKNQIMADFKERKIQILVSTPVVEVGIDIPHATIIVIEAAERFGLSQLHQLRGRVGRADKQSYCFLFTESLSNTVKGRLNFFCQNNLGIKLAEYDLKIRGPGEIYGEKQHGFINLKIASLIDYPLIKKSKNAVDYFLARYQITNFPFLQQRINDYQIKQIARD